MWVTKTSFNIVLKIDECIDEVVVVAYGSQKAKQTVTGAAAMKSSELRRLPGNNEPTHWLVLPGVIASSSQADVR